MLVRAAILALALFIGIAHSQEKPRPSKRNTASETQQNAPERTGTDERPFVIKIKPNDRDKLEAESREKERQDKASSENDLVYWTRVLAVLALAQFAALIIQASIFRNQSKRLKETVDEMRKEFVASHRPKVALRTITLDDTGDWPEHGEPTPGTLRYALVNSGASTAHISCRNFTIQVIRPMGSGDRTPNKLPPWPEYEIKKNNTTPLDLPPGDIEFTENISTQSRLDWMGAEVSAQTNVYLIGFIAYTDDAGRRFRTAFARMRNTGTGRFLPIDNSDYEYQY